MVGSNFGQTTRTLEPTNPPGLSNVPSDRDLLGQFSNTLMIGNIPRNEFD